jgi:type IV pilus assembly protein PilX
MKFNNAKQQSGMVLIVSLLVLITLTVLGLAAMQSSRTEMSMAGNQRELGITFSAAEAGLSAGQSYIDNSISKTIYNDPSKGLYDSIDIDPDYRDPATWDDSQTADIGLPHVVEQPRYIIKYLGDRSQNEVAAVNIGGYGSAQPGITVSNFRISTRAVGQTGRATRQLQAYYGKEF